MHIATTAAALSVISQYLHIPCLIPQPSERIFHGAVRQISFKINEKSVLPVPIFNRATLDFRHIQVIINKMGKHMIQRTAFMRYLKTNADLTRFLQKDFLIRYNNEPRGICMGMIHAPLQNLQTVNLGRLLTGYGRLTFIPVLHDLSCRKSIILHTDLLPGGMII